MTPSFESEDETSGEQKPSLTVAVFSGDSITPPKFKSIPFLTPSFWVSMLIFGGVAVSQLDDFVTKSLQKIGNAW